MTESTTVALEPAASSAPSTPPTPMTTPVETASTTDTSDDDNDIDQYLTVPSATPAPPLALAFLFSALLPKGEIDRGSRDKGSSLVCGVIWTFHGF
jgi:hypothetical protein